MQASIVCTKICLYTWIPYKVKYSKNSLHKIRKRTYERRRKTDDPSVFRMQKKSSFHSWLTVETWTEKYWYIVHNITEYDKQNIRKTKHNLYHSISAFEIMIYGKYKYFSHKFNNLEERHAELFMIVSIREFSEICSLSLKPYTSLRIRASNPSVLFSTNMLLALQYLS